MQTIRHFRISSTKCMLSILLLGFLLTTGCANTHHDQARLVNLETEVYLADKYPIPQFKVDPSWPGLPQGKLIGQVSGLSVDSRDNIWILQRPESVDKADLGLAQSPPSAVCCRTLPHVLAFSPTGNLINRWGGPELAPEINGINQWPTSAHGLFVDVDNTIWFAGSGTDNHVVLNFTDDGQFIRQYGERGKTGGNQHPTLLGNPADIFHDPATGEVLIADGYVNRRIISYKDAGKTFDQVWGAFGKPPSAATRSDDFNVSQATGGETGNPDAPTFGDMIHCVTRSDDGLYYVCDRRNNRVQVFKRDGQGKMQFVHNIIVAPKTGYPGSASDVTFSPDGKYIYVADMANGKIWIYWRDTFELLASVGRIGRYAGQFTWLHSLDADSSGNLYTSEVRTGQRVQKLVLTGFSEAP